MSVHLIIWELLCMGLLWSVFCRLVRTSTLTLISVRVSIFALGCAALVGLGAPMYGWQPDAVVIIITGACLLMQIVASRHWRKGVPGPFQANGLDIGGSK